LFAAEAHPHTPLGSLLRFPRQVGCRKTSQTTCTYRFPCDQRYQRSVNISRIKSKRNIAAYRV